MSWRTELVQIMALIAAMIVASFFPIPYLSVVLASVRTLLLLLLGVAIVYLGVLLSRQQMQPLPIQHDEERLHEIERGR